MVKNKSGGSRHKKMARKNVKDYGVAIKTRFPSCADEIFARVIRMNGQGTCEVICNDNERRLCYIRQKFSGRHKRDNFINIDTMLLVGKREWATNSKKKLPKVDLLYVYGKSQFEQLRNAKGFNQDILPEMERVSDNGIVFSYDSDEEEVNTKITISTKKVEKMEKIEEDMDFDDI